MRAHQSKRMGAIVRELNSNDAKWRMDAWHIEWCAAQQTHWLIMITMQQYDLIRHLNEILKGVLLTFARIAQTQLNHTDGPMPRREKEWKKKSNCFVFTHCFCLAHVQPIPQIGTATTTTSTEKGAKWTHTHTHEIDGPSSEIFIKINEIQWMYFLVYRFAQQLFFPKFSHFLLFRSLCAFCGERAYVDQISQICVKISFIKMLLCA